MLTKVSELFTLLKNNWIERNGRNGMKRFNKPNLLFATEKKRLLQLMKRLKLKWN